MRITNDLIKMDTRTKLLVLPLIDDKFYNLDPFKSYVISSKKDIEAEYQKFIDNILVNYVYPKLINSNNAIINLEEVRLLFQQYFPKNRFVNAVTPNEFYSEYFTEISRIFFTHRNGQISLKYWESNDHYMHETKILGPYRGIYKIAVWNSLNRTFTTDILAILYLLDLNMIEEYNLKSFIAGINVADTQLEKVLNKGIAETHLHLNAAGNFDFTWQTLMANKNVSDQVFRNSYESNIELKFQIKAMSIVRIILALFLEESKKDENPSLSQYAIERYMPYGTEFEFSTINFLDWIANAEIISDRISESHLSIIIENLVLNLELFPIELNSNDFLTRFGQGDIIHKILLTFGEESTVERIFLFRSLKYLKFKGCNDELFQNIFWQYIRVKNKLFQLHIQQNSVKGLEHFVNYFGRATGIRIDDEKQRLGYLLNYQAQNKYLKKLEVRISVGSGNTVKNKKRSLARKLRYFFLAYIELIKEFELSNKSVPDIGIIIHFIKSRIKILDDKNIYEAYKKKVNNYYNEMLALVELREDIKGLSNYLVGIDAAGEELVTEPWIFSKIFRHARDSKSQNLFYKEHDYRNILNLGLTYHVGEDFRHLLSGLRWIDEVIEYFQYRAGDRLGHAVALGINVERWVGENPVITLPRMEHLENLLWIWDLCVRGRCPIHIDIPFLEHEIMTVARHIYTHTNGITIHDLLYNYKNKFFKFDKEKSPYLINLKDITYWSRDILSDSMFNEVIHKNMLEPIQIRLGNKETTLIRDIQHLLINELSNRGIIVETNPSSNTAIASLGSVFEHYIQQLNQMNTISEKKAIQVTINTDDPVIFNTNINNEFAYIFFALQEKGYSREEILNWIDKIREIGINSSFIEDRKITTDQRNKEINFILEELESYT
jgi:adenosine deaminase